jgi:hypothetical protein
MPPRVLRHERGTFWRVKRVWHKMDCSLCPKDRVYNWVNFKLEQSQTYPDTLKLPSMTRAVYPQDPRMASAKSALLPAWVLGIQVWAQMLLSCCHPDLNIDRECRNVFFRGPQLTSSCTSRSLWNTVVIQGGLTRGKQCWYSEFRAWL